MKNNKQATETMKQLWNTMKHNEKQGDTIKHYENKTMNNKDNTEKQRTKTWSIKETQRKHKEHHASASSSFFQPSNLPTSAAPSPPSFQPSNQQTWRLQLL